MRYPSLFLVLLTLVPASVAAQEPESGYLIGTVTSATVPAPLSGARVSAAEIGSTTETDRLGRFRLVLPAGQVQVRVEMLGYATFLGSVEVTPGGVTRLEPALTETPLAVDPLVVLLDRTRLLGDPRRIGAIPGAAQELDRRDLQAQNSAFDNVHDVLRQIPGVNIQEEDGYGLRPNIGLRGTGVERSAKITVMEDGVLSAPAPYTAPAAYYFPVTARMEAVEVRKGSSQVKYGPRTIGGAINLVSTPVPEGTEWAADLAGGQDGTFKARGRVGGSTAHVGWLLETVQMRTSGFKELASGSDTGFRVGDYLAKLRFRTDVDAEVYQELGLKFGMTDHVSSETYLGLTDDDFRANPVLRYPASQPDRMDANHRAIQAQWFIRPTQGIDLTTTVYRTDFNRNWYKLHSVMGQSIAAVLEDPASYPDALATLRGRDSDPEMLRVRANNRSYFARGIQSALGWTPAGHRLEVGARFHQDQEDRFQWEDGYGMEDGRMRLSSLGAPGSQSNRVSDASAVALYVKDDIRLGALTVSPGLRHESVDFTRTDYAGSDPDRTGPTAFRENSVSAWIPGLAASFEFGANQAFAGVHRGFGPPGAGAAPATEAEASVNYELGGRLRTRGTVAQVAFFYSDYRNILGTASLSTGESGSGDQFNGGAADVAGMELEARVAPVVSRTGTVSLPLSLSYTYTRSRFGTSFDSDFGPWGSVQAGDEVPYLPKHQVSASAAIQGPGWSLSVNAFGASAMRTKAGQGPMEPTRSTDAYAVLNLVSEYELPGSGTIYATLQNLMDARYIVSRRPSGVRPGLPRTLLVGFRMSG